MREGFHPVKLFRNLQFNELYSTSKSDIRSKVMTNATSMVCIGLYECGIAPTL